MENLPEFGDPNAPPTEPPSPKKPRRKPVKRRKKKALAPAPDKKAAKRALKRRSIKILDPINPAAPKEFEVVQSIIKAMLLLDRATAKSVANLLGAIFT